MIDVIGTIFARPALPEGYVPMPEGDLIPDAELRAGWHVNTTPEVLEQNPALADYVITPSTMRRVWSGDDPQAPSATVALRFADQDQAEAVLGAMSLLPPDPVEAPAPDPE